MHGDEIESLDFVISVFIWTDLVSFSGNWIVQDSKDSNMLPSI